MWKWITIAALGLITLLLAATLVIERHRRGVQVTIANVGTTAISDVIVIVRGATHELRGLGPGEDRAVFVLPTGESHVEVTWKDEMGRECSGLIDCYIEGPRSFGTASMRINGAAVAGTKRDINYNFFSE
jgi:hypothetical protein